MKTLTIKDLELDVLENRYVGLNCKIYLKDGEVLETQIDGYTYDDEPFCNYIEIGEEEIPFNAIEKIEIIN
ncbi:hypothetical protein [Helcococcus sueciensis]|uniref:hypothetical protein n=1 Tax=Helcococcus sueciensis TaxID=241555 RepID=UPI00040C6677|nr:hypothetical protein [Helcococcus sueciensis]